VTFDDERDAEDAIKSMDGAELDGRTIKVNKPQPPPPPPSPSPPPPSSPTPEDAPSLGLLALLILLVPIAYVLYVKLRFNGQVWKYYAWRFSHSNPYVVWRYLPSERRARVAMELFHPAMAASTSQASALSEEENPLDDLFKGIEGYSENYAATAAPPQPASPIKPPDKGAWDGSAWEGTNPPTSVDAAGAHRTQYRV